MLSHILMDTSHLLFFFLFRAARREIAASKQTAIVVSLVGVSGVAVSKNVKV